MLLLGSSARNANKVELSIIKTICRCLKILMISMEESESKLPLESGLYGYVNVPLLLK